MRILRISVLFLFGLITAHSCSHKTNVTRTERSAVMVDAQTQDDSVIFRMIEPYKKALDAEMNTVLVKSAAAAVKNDPEGALGNLVADIVLESARTRYMLKYQQQIDFCLLNKGGLRTSLPKGEITMGKVYELMPFENELVVLTLSGKKTQDLFNYVAYNKGMPLAGVKMGINDSLAVNVLINGSAFDATREYKVVTSDYLAAGGDKMKFFKNALAVDTLHYKVRDVLIDYMKAEGAKGNELHPTTDGRIYYDK